MQVLPLKVPERFGVEQLLKRSSGLLTKEDSVDFAEAQQKER